ncbi:hypothetical protein HJG60_009887 [Phyllostomus discolor]|uniref:Uncharacterized protein n=1 Tax=Phyllostomus discolor TaxID=89673 RepID=A0A834BAB3_9CHIR|nr:hypothetical protein HJG60_009887 [Phyllostomus discolor]
MCLRVAKRSHPWQFQEHGHLGRYLLSGAKWGGQSWRVKGWEGISARTGVAVGDTRPASPSHICFGSQLLYSILTWSSHRQPLMTSSLFSAAPAGVQSLPTVSLFHTFRLWHHCLEVSLPQVSAPPQYCSIPKIRFKHCLSVKPPVCSASSGSQSP